MAATLLVSLLTAALLGVSSCGEMAYDEYEDYEAPGEAIPMYPAQQHVRPSLSVPHPVTAPASGAEQALPSNAHLLPTMPVVNPQPVQTAQPLVVAAAAGEPADQTAPRSVAAGLNGGCFDVLDSAGVDYTTQGQSSSDSHCQIAHPIKLSSNVNGIKFSGNGMLASCELGRRIYLLTMLVKARRIVEIGQYGTYNCRKIAGSSSWSNHANANAIDLAWFKDADGKEYNLVKHYWDNDERGAFLRWLGEEMHQQKLFNTVLTPAYNSVHANHFHVDINGKGTYYKKFTAQPEEAEEYYFGENLTGD